MNSSMTTGSIEIGGDRVHYMDGGEGPPLILFHGRTPDLRFIEPLRTRLAHGFRVVAPIRPYRAPGAGESRLAKQTMELLSEIGIGAAGDGVVRASLVGWGDGGLLALYIARHYPGRVERVAAINPTFQLARDSDRASGIPLYTTPDSVPPDGVETLHGFPFSDPQAWATIARRMEENGIVFTLDGDAQLLPFDRIRAPVLVLAGDRDLVAPERNRALASAFPNGRLAILPGCGPFAPLEKPDEVAEILKGFMDSPLLDHV